MFRRELLTLGSSSGFVRCSGSFLFFCSQEVCEVPKQKPGIFEALISQQKAEVWVPQSPFQYITHEAAPELQPGGRAQQEEKGTSGGGGGGCEGGWEGGEGLPCFPVEKGEQLS